MSYLDHIYKPLKDGVIREVKIEDQQFTIALETGTQHTYGVEGDCCSYSWIEHMTVPDDIKGATILGVDEFEVDTPPGVDKSQFEVLQCYETRIKTTKGDIVLEFRNDSNGYYGGYVVAL